MKIGKFSELNNITIDSIRYYMDMGLLIPEKSGGQFEFDDRCKKDLDDILKFKSMDFTLNEIKSIFFFKRLGKLSDYQEQVYYKKFFENKLDRVKSEIDNLENVKEVLQKKLNEMNPKETDVHKMGVNINVLDLLECPACHAKLNLTNGTVTDNQIINGVLECSCGVKYKISDGIIIGDDSINSNDYKVSIAEYIISTDPDYLDNVCRNMEWMYKRLDFSEFNNKVLMDIGSGIGYFLRYIYNDLPDSSIYFSVDFDLNRHRMLKDILETSGCRKNIVFLCSDFKNIPVKNEAVDVFFDMSGTSNYSFEHCEFLLTLIDKYLKKNSSLFGLYILFKNFAANSKIEPKYRKNFLLNHISDEIKKLGFKMTDEKVSSYIENGGKYENYFTENEKVHTYAYTGKR